MTSDELTTSELAAAIAEPPSEGEMKLYWDVIPPPSQAVLLTLSCLPLLRHRLRLVRVNVMRSQQFDAAFRAISPLHQVPLLEEADGSVLAESRAIMIYLAELAGEAGRALYPSEPRARAACHQWLLFDVTCLYACLKEYHLPVMLGKAGRPVDAALLPLHEALAALEASLRRHRHAAGEELTLADLGLAVTVAQARAVGVDLSRYGAITAWYSQLRRDLPGLERAEAGSAEYAAILRQNMDGWRRNTDGSV